MQLSDFHYDLPDELIARHPLAERSASRLLVLDQAEPSHRGFKDVLSLLNPGDLLVCNDTRVIPARMLGTKATGGRVEVLVERILGRSHFSAQVRASKSPRPGSYILLDQGVKLEVTSRNDRLFELRCLDERPVLDVIESIGQIPLPPYMERTPDEADKTRYQTVYAKHKGSVAAPTAGLHFDEPLMQAIRAKGVDVAYLTLHVGAGTFAPVRVQTIQEHRMHPEYISVPNTLCEKISSVKARQGRVVAVGTTTLRSLESASRQGVIQPYEGETDIFIYPGFQFNCVDALITNFHLPCSTLLMLVTALGGYERVMRAYHEAVKEKYRFFSYGDAMWLSPSKRSS